MNHLERRLRAERPSPPEDLLDGIVSRVSRPATERLTGLRRLGLAALAGAVMLTVLGAFGGVGAAASGVSGAAASTVNAVSGLVNPDQSSTLGGVAVGSSTNSNGNGDNGDGNGNGNGNGNGDDECEDDDDNGASEGEYCPPRETICHVTPSGQQNTLTLPPVAAQHHLQNHQPPLHPGDYPGPCIG